MIKTTATATTLVWNILLYSLGNSIDGDSGKIIPTIPTGNESLLTGDIGKIILNIINSGMYGCSADWRGDSPAKDLSGNARSLLRDLANFKVPGTVGDVVNVLITVGAGVGGVVNAVLPGGNTILAVTWFIITGVGVLKIVICVLGSPGLTGAVTGDRRPGYDNPKDVPAICQSGFEKKFGLKAFNGDSTSASDIYNYYNLGDLDAKFKSAINKKTNGQGVNGLKGSQKIIAQWILQLTSLINKRQNGNFSKNDVNVLSQLLVKIAGGIGNSYQSGLGDNIAQKLVDYLAASTKSNKSLVTISLTGQLPQIKKDIDRCSSNNWGGAIKGSVGGSNGSTNNQNNEQTTSDDASDDESQITNSQDDNSQNNSNQNDNSETNNSETNNSQTNNSQTTQNNQQSGSQTNENGSTSNTDQSSNDQYNSDTQSNNNNENGSTSDVSNQQNGSDNSGSQTIENGSTSGQNYQQSGSDNSASETSENGSSNDGYNQQNGSENSENETSQTSNNYQQSNSGSSTQINKNSSSGSNNSYSQNSESGSDQNSEQSSQNDAQEDQQSSQQTSQDGSSYSSNTSSSSKKSSSGSTSSKSGSSSYQKTSSGGSQSQYSNGQVVIQQEEYQN
ncbi:hypothetical protein ABMA27_012350 [Loxostege sticticalis]|uniref:Uncharacterized protein n=1 Tax=Loxostege sticticalis TaxID=481309 RepID=A0ABR3H0Z5_LOXSC